MRNRTEPLYCYGISLCLPLRALVPSCETLRSLPKSGKIVLSMSKFRGLCRTEAQKTHRSKKSKQPGSRNCEQEANRGSGEGALAALEKAFFTRRHKGTKQPRESNSGRARLLPSLTELGGRFQP